MKAYVLIHVRPGEIPEVRRNMLRLSNVTAVHMTFGPYDVVAEVEAEDINKLGRLVASEIQPIPGIVDTLTCLVVDS